MGDSISRISDDIEEYEDLCEHFAEHPSMKQTPNGLVVDCYGEHAKNLKERWGFESLEERAQRQRDLGFLHATQGTTPRRMHDSNYKHGYEQMLGRPYYCQRCRKAPATIHLTEIIDKNKTEQHLCDSCAQVKMPRPESEPAGNPGGDKSCTIGAEDYGRILGELASIAKQQRERAEAAEAELEDTNSRYEKMVQSLQKRFKTIQKLEGELETTKATEKRRESARDGAYKQMCALQKETEQQQRLVRTLDERVDFLRSVVEGLRCELQHTPLQKHLCQACRAKEAVRGDQPIRTPCTYHKGFKENCGCP